MTIVYVETFSVSAAGALLRSVTPKRGRPYVHSCTLATLVEVSHLVDEMDSFTGEELVSRSHAAHTQVFVALAFLKEHCIVERVFGRRCVASNRGGSHLDAMVEYHALREGA